MKTTILASNNKHKIREFREMFPSENILSLADIGFYEDITEDGKTFKENSLIKARAVQEFIKTKGINASIIADDSGLCVDALNGEPGIFSARYSENHDDRQNRIKLLENLQNKANRSAHFNCTLVELFPDGSYIVAVGKTFGTITYDETGDSSFGYDCIFLSNELNKTFGEASSEEKNAVSHRGKAIQGLKRQRELKLKTS